MGLSILSTGYSLIITKLNYSNIANLALSTQEKFVLRVNERNQVEQISCKVIMPGDYILIKKDQKIPCDCYLLDGSCLVNESTLTGESIAVSKERLI